MNLDLYSDELFAIQIDTYMLGEALDIYTPQVIIQHSIANKDQFSVAISNDDGMLVGFFGLHLGASSEEHGYIGGTYALIKDISIDERYRDKGYDIRCFDKIFEFINQEINEEIRSVFLSIGVENTLAQKAYEKAGFKKRDSFFEGRYGNLVIMEKHNIGDQCN